MPKDIVWSPLAKEDVTIILDYLMQHWNINVVNSFLDKIEATVSIISEHPERFQVINLSLQVRKCVITKHNTLFFRNLPDKIEILRLFDTRQNPDKLGIEKD